MPQRRQSLKEVSEDYLVQRLLAILVNAAEGRRSVSDDTQYPNLRSELRRRLDVLPKSLSTHPSVDSFSAEIRGISKKTDRVRRIRNEFAPLLLSAPSASEDATSSSDWTGVQTRSSRLKAVRNLIPLAQAAVEGMIAALSDTGGNHAPLLDERQEAVDNLRKLHAALGNLLAAADAGHLDDDLGAGFAAESARYAKRAAKALRDDPMPYVASGLLHSVLWMCGVPGVGVFLGGIAQNIRRNVADREN